MDTQSIVTIERFRRGKRKNEPNKMLFFKKRNNSTSTLSSISSRATLSTIATETDQIVPDKARTRLFHNVSMFNDNQIDDYLLLSSKSKRLSTAIGGSTEWPLSNESQSKRLCLLLDESAPTPSSPLKLMANTRTISDDNYPSMLPLDRNIKFLRPYRTIPATTTTTKTRFSHNHLKQNHHHHHHHHYPNDKYHYHHSNPNPNHYYHYPNNNLLLLFILITFALISHVSCLGIFELRFDKFVNELNRDASGKCCIGETINNVNITAELNSTSNHHHHHYHHNNHNHHHNHHNSQSICDQPCQTYFRVCFKNYQANIDTSSNCLYGEKSTPVLSYNSSHHHSLSSTNHNHNLIQFPFNFTWPGTFSLIIEVWNNGSSYEYSAGQISTSSTTGSSAPVKQFGRTRSLIARSYESRRDALPVGHQWTTHERRINQTTLQYSYRILCDKNYYGNSCTIKCTPRNDLYGHYSCGPNGEKICHPGWTNEYCDKPICRSCNETNGICISPDKCQCRMGWTGDDCTQCVQYPNCKHGYCNVAMECICKEGWGGLLCDKDLNYCTNNQPCKNGGLCSNTGDNSFTCQCQPGFAGQYCEKEVDSCDHSPCYNGATCKSNAVSNYTCECPIGYHGRHCEHLLSACTNNPCENDGTCIDGPSGFLCACKLGYSGSKCQIKQKGCSPNPCHGGICTMNGHSNDSYSCQCRPGFTGDHCEINIDDCGSSPCLNSGTCIDEIDTFRCRCMPGFVGELCEVNIDECAMKPCVNGATCVDRNNDYVCICPPGFTGKDCSINIDDCASEPCFNNGYCQDRVNGFECLCLPSYSGSRCEYSNELSLNNNNLSSTSYWAENRKTEKNIDLISMGQLSMIAIIVSLLVLIIIILSIGVIIFKHVKTQGIKMKRRQDAAQAQRENEHNAIMSSGMNNKYLDQCFNRSAANVIVNSLTRPASLHQLNKCHKVTNEYVFSGQLFNKCATLAPNYGYKSVNTNNSNNNNHYHHQSQYKLTNSEPQHSYKVNMDDAYNHTYEQIINYNHHNSHHQHNTKTSNLLCTNLSNATNGQYSPKQSNLNRLLWPVIDHKSSDHYAQGFKL